MIGLGTFAIILALVDYHGILRYRWSPEFQEIAGIRDRPVWASARPVAIMLALVGVVTLVTLILRTGSGAP